MSTPTSTQPAEQMVPRLRGQLHAYAFWGALVAACALVAVAPSGSARAACVIYGCALCALFAVSALYHRWRWDPRWRPLLRRLDHSTIHVFIAASTTPLAVLVLDGRMQAFVLAAAWAGALGGIALSLAWIDARAHSSPPATSSSDGRRSPRCRNCRSTCPRHHYCSSPPGR